LRRCRGRVDANNSKHVRVPALTRPRNARRLHYRSDCGGYAEIYLLIIRNDHFLTKIELLITQVVKQIQAGAVTSTTGSNDGKRDRTNVFKGVRVFESHEVLLTAVKRSRKFVARNTFA
jgi:hypothetical protein